MKVFISADIEGTAGIAHWNEAERTHPDWAEFRALMTGEVVAACEGARAAGATEVVIKDAHDSGRNLLLDRLPDYVRIVRGWSGHPDEMMFGIDAGFAAAIYTGYHSKAGAEGNPLAHTSNLRISRLLLNGEVASEFTFNALCAAGYGVPSVFLAGDVGICAEARAMVPGLATGGIADSIRSPARLHPVTINIPGGGSVGGLLAPSNVVGALEREVLRKAPTGRSPTWKGRR